MVGNTNFEMSFLQLLLFTNIFFAKIVMLIILISGKIFVKSSQIFLET